MNPRPVSGVGRSSAGTLADGTEVERLVLADGPLRLSVLTLGGATTHLLVPDAGGDAVDVLLGFDDLAGYLTDHPFFGVLVGRYANRIARGRFPLNGREVELAVNDLHNHLHGGPVGFHARVWTPQVLDGRSVRLSLDSPDGDEGYPGALHVEVTYTVAGADVRIDYAATSTEPAGGPDTVVNLTNHAYFNLAGHDAGPIDDHVVELFASRYTPVDVTLIPTGELAAVAGSPMDLRSPRRFADGWDAAFEQLRYGHGYDHNWVLDDPRPGVVALAARVAEPRSGRILEVWTDQPGLQLYTGNYLTGEYAGKGGHGYGAREGFCLETQHFPDSPNRPAFPSTVLAPGQTFTSTTIWRFPHLTPS